MNKPQIIESKDIFSYREYLWHKTTNLKICIDGWFNVPTFVALPSYIMETLFTNLLLREEIVTQIIQILPVKMYAVRSSALIEDNNKESFAWQFFTKTEVSKENLGDAIYQALQQAHTYLDGDISLFSILIQEYIPADTSWVIFTRNPLWKREMIIEYASGKWENIVSGNIQPTRQYCYQDDTSAINIPQKMAKTDLLQICKDIETLFAFPQDIERCIKENNLYILQTRPITTISPKTYKEILLWEEYITNALWHRDNYYLSKTKVSESIPRPTNFMYDILKIIYAEDGPIARVYNQHNIKYTYTDFLHIIWNELYIDQEKDLRSLFPSLSYFKRKWYIIWISQYKNIRITLKNMRYLNTIKPRKIDMLFPNLQKAIHTTLSTNDIHTAVQEFMQIYKRIFEINLYCGISMKRLDTLLKKQNISSSHIIANAKLFTNTSLHIQAPENLLGNSLDISDESDFIWQDFWSIKEDKEIKIRRDSKNTYTQKYLLKFILPAIQFNHLREYSRRLTVKHISHIRDILTTLSKGHTMDRETIYFAHINEIEDIKLNKHVLAQRKISYNNYNHMTLPHTITKHYIHKKTTILWVSPGISSWILITEEEINDHHTNAKYILYTRTLSPHLAIYFNNIVGIISENGWLLSHLAIIAREKWLPVIINNTLQTKNDHLGKILSINGSTGEITLIQSNSRLSPKK